MISVDPDLFDHPDVDETEYLWPVLSSQGDHSGPPADHVILNYANSQEKTIFASATYPSGNQGQDLQTYGGDVHIYALSSIHCTKATIINNASLQECVTVNSEYIIGRQTIREAMSLVQFPWVPLQTQCHAEFSGVVE